MRNPLFLFGFLFLICSIALILIVFFISPYKLDGSISPLIIFLFTASCSGSIFAFLGMVGYKIRRILAPFGNTRRMYVVSSRQAGIIAIGLGIGFILKIFLLLNPLTLILLIICSGIIEWFFRDSK